MSIAVMAAPLPDSGVRTPRKRNYEGEFVLQTSASPHAETELQPASTCIRQSSPALSETSSELTELTSTGIASPAHGKSSADGMNGSSTPGSIPIKKRKLTFAEKEVEKAVRQREKEEKAKQKAEEKQRKEDEKQRKEEEKRQKDEEKRRKREDEEASKRAKDLEKAEKKKVRDAEKQEKDAEKARKDAEKKEKETEKLKKERSQLRIGAFFGRPAAQSTPPTTPDDASTAPSSRRSSIAALELSEPVLKASVTRPTNPEFEQYIIPYFVHENTELAPANRFQTFQAPQVFGGDQSSYHLEIEKADVEPIARRFGPSRRRLKIIEPVKDVAERISSTQINHEDLADDFNPIADVPYKILSFKEDARPPYIGTYTKRIVSDVARKLSRKPMHRGRPDTNYDYDSEAEWEEPAADDEEILDDEMSESEDGDEDMQDFLDDENDQGRRRMFASEMEPICSGLCFEGEQFNSNGHNMEDYRMDVLHDSTTFPIDPYSTVHWSEIGKLMAAQVHLETNTAAHDSNKAEQNVKSMPPPRVPLATLSTPNTLNTFFNPGTTVTAVQNENAQTPAKPRGRTPNANKDLKIVAPEFMDAFKQAIDGSDLTKAGLIEILKKQFPRCSKDAIKDTLGVVAVRVGKKEAEKKWMLV